MCVFFIYKYIFVYVSLLLLAVIFTYFRFVFVAVVWFLFKQKKMETREMVYTRSESILSFLTAVYICCVGCMFVAAVVSSLPFYYTNFSVYVFSYSLLSAYSLSVSRHPHPSHGKHITTTDRSIFCRIHLVYTNSFFSLSLLCCCISALLVCCCYVWANESECVAHQNDEKWKDPCRG